MILISRITQGYSITLLRNNKFIISFKLYKLSKHHLDISTLRHYYMINSSYVIKVY